MLELPDSLDGMLRQPPPGPLLVGFEDAVLDGCAGGVPLLDGIGVHVGPSPGVPAMTAHHGLTVREFRPARLSPVLSTRAI